MSYSPPTSPSYLYPVVCDLSDVEYTGPANQRTGSGSLSSVSTNGVQPQTFCPCPEEAGHHSLDFSFADLGVPLDELIRSTATRHPNTDRLYSEGDDDFLEEGDAFPHPIISPDTLPTAPCLSAFGDDDEEGSLVGEDEPLEGFATLALSSSLVMQDNDILGEKGIKVLSPPRSAPRNHPRRLASWKRGFWKRSRRSVNDNQRRITCSTSHSMDGSSTTKDDDEPPAALFDDVYLLTRQILQGFQYVLWECVHRTTGKAYLVKIFSWNTEVEERDVEHVDQAARSIPEKKVAHHEVEILQRIADRDSIGLEHVVKLVHVFHEKDSIRVVLENPGVNVRTLQHCVLRQGCLPESTVCGIMGRVLEALHHLHHDMGICHSQIQPLHILVTASDEAFIADFGTATISCKAAPLLKEDSQHTDILDRAESNRSHFTNQMLTSGSLLRSAYTAPELLQLHQVLHAGHQSSPHGACCDEAGCEHDEATLCGCGGGVSTVWSLGVLMHYCLLGHVPPYLDYHQRQQQQHHPQTTSSGHFPHHSDSALYVPSGATALTPHASCRHCRSVSEVSVHPISSAVTIAASSYNEAAGRWHNPQNPISRQAKQFLTCCLHQDSSIRLTLPEALDHLWIRPMRRPVPRKASPRRSWWSQRRAWFGAQREERFSIS